MKPKYGALCIGLILALVASLLLIPLPGSANLYAAYVFCLMGIVLLVAGVWATDDNAPASYALLGQVAWFLPVSLFISAVVLVLQHTEAYRLSLLWHCIIQVILLSVAAIRIVLIYVGKKSIADTDKRVAQQRNSLAAVLNEANALQAKVNALPEEIRIEANKALKQVIESLRFSDPMSTNAVQEMDAEIEKRVAELKGNCKTESAEQFVAGCQALIDLIRERNGVLKASKS